MLLVLSGKVQRQQTLTSQGRDIEEKPQDNKRKRQNWRTVQFWGFNTNIPVGIDTFQELFNILNPNLPADPAAIMKCDPRCSSERVTNNILNSHIYKKNYYQLVLLSLCSSSQGAIYRFKQIPDWPEYTVRVVATPSPSRQRTFEILYISYHEKYVPDSNLRMTRVGIWHYWLFPDTWYTFWRTWIYFER